MPDGAGAPCRFALPGGVMTAVEVALGVAGGIILALFVHESKDRRTLMSLWVIALFFGLLLQIGLKAWHWLR